MPLACELQRQLLQPLLGHVPGQEPIRSLLATPPGLDSSPRGGRVPEGGSQGSLDKPVLLLANWDGIPNKHPLTALTPPADSEVVRRCQQRILARMVLWPRGQKTSFLGSGTKASGPPAQPKVTSEREAAMRSAPERGSESLALSQISTETIIHSAGNVVKTNRSRESLRD